MSCVQKKKFSADDYTVGIICAIPKELLAVRTLFDEKHEKLRTAKADTVHYSLGRMGSHLVTAACLPSGEYGNNASSAVIQDMRRTFPRLESCLLVGIGGGVPSPDNDIRLGDVVVCHPNGAYPAIVQYDMGKMLESGRFETTGGLHPPPRLLMTAISDLRSNPDPESSSLRRYLNKTREKKPAYGFPGRHLDVLFAVDSPRRATDAPYQNCQCVVVSRPERLSDEAEISNGPIGSGNQVVKSAEHRDILWERHKILCVEMEAAGVMNSFPSLVIRGICDYSDSHKTKAWQEYAAATAAAYARLLLSVLRDHHDEYSRIRLHPPQKTKARDIIPECSQAFGSSPLDARDIDTLRSGELVPIQGNDSHEAQFDRLALFEALKPEAQPEEDLAKNIRFSKTSPSWNPWPKDINSFYLLESLNRWVSDPLCSLLMVRGTPGRSLSELPSSEDFLCAIVQLLRGKADFPVVWAFSNRDRAQSNLNDLIKTIIYQGLGLLSDGTLENISRNWALSQAFNEERLFNLLYDTLQLLPQCFLVLEVKNATLASKIHDTIEQLIKSSELNLKIMIVAYDLDWRTSNGISIENCLMPSIRLRGSQPGWVSCWNNFKPQFL
ncbi:hypothetical protein N7478_011158 [Penicillium angulare]|uniref:uncharacterized protein n=1 Tax=Penicillium angulare TaxID=116970 RepID=UPI0025407EEA|nr:uncharacterized protein N7478_011158 [Penicillium angulare]KAJ5263553.1 hypothetical protein N7478_011158 [Penicillium angulare]